MYSNSVLRIAAELNNVGVRLHECKKHDEAEVLYREAMKAMISVESNNTEGQNKHEDQCRKWRDLIMAEKAMTSNPDPNRTTTRTTTPVDAASMHSLTFSRPLLVDMDFCQPIHNDSMSLLMLYNMALIQNVRGMYGRAEELLDLALSHLPIRTHLSSMTVLGGVAVHYHLGMLWLRKRRIDESFQLFNRAYGAGKRVLGDHLLVACILNAMGQILFLRGFIDDAMGAFTEASRITYGQTMKAIVLDAQKDAGNVVALAA